MPRRAGCEGHGDERREEASRAKAEAKKRAETNVRLHGRTKAERELEARQKARLERCVDGARLTPTTDDDGENT
ncbi:MAG: DUF4169 family protein [Deltaproteobacteria bacterium]|nr:DUF4169 family protein [Deltaproteobacteria bacterium]